MIATIAGRLGRDAELKDVGQTALCSFSLAFVQLTKVDGTWTKTTQWVRCAVWGTRGTALCSYLTKGSAVTVVGEVRASLYEPEGGVPRVNLDMRVDHVMLQGSKGDPGQSRAESRDTEAPAAPSGDEDDMPF